MRLGDFNVIHNVLFQIGCAHSQIITVDQFNTLPMTRFFDLQADIQLMTVLKNSPLKTLLDVDAHFVESSLLTKGDNDSTEIDLICVEDLLPVKENIYSHVYKNFSDCCLKHYDAALITVNSPLDFDTIFLSLENCADVIITFSRYNSELLKHLQMTAANFAKIDVLRSYAGMWLMCYRRKPPEDIAVYVATHKALPSEHIEKLPEGYRIIHSGKAVSQDLGYIGDNTGDNISHLNPYVNEITALYWLWKNTSHTIIGLSHYRRFFTMSDDETFAYDKILTHEDICKLLNKYDIVVGIHEGPVMQIEYIKNSCGDLTQIGASIIKKHLTATNPNYVDSFDMVMNSKYFNKCNMFIARRYVSDAYCKWLFSFYIDSVHEVLRTIPLSAIQPPMQRLLGYFAERMLSVWLMKNRLRVKELKIMQVEGL